MSEEEQNPKLVRGTKSGMLRRDFIRNTGFIAGGTILGGGIANPLATILSVAMLLRYTFDEAGFADQIEQAVETVLDDGLRTADISDYGDAIGTVAMGDAVIERLPLHA